MNKTFVGILLGLLIGAGATWFALRSSTAATPAKTEVAEAKAPEKENPLHLSPAKRTAAGIALAKPTEATIAPEVQVFGRVLDATPLVTLLGELEIGRAASAASEKEAERTKKLFAAGANASAQAVELAEANASRDRAIVAAAKGKLLAGWGRDVVAGVESLAPALEAGAVLVRLDLLPGEALGAGAKVARVSLAGSSNVFDAEILGVSPTADPQMQSASLLAIVRNHPLPAGAALRGALPGAGEAAKMLAVPRSAIVYHQGSAWAFVLGEEDTFERKLVKLDRAVGDDQVAVAQGLEASEQVVIAGAQQLLAAELQAGGAPEGD